MTLTLCAGMGAAMVACDDGASGDSVSTSAPANKETTYNFKVLNKDNTPANGYKIQLCKKNADGSLGACLVYLAPVVNGVATFPVTDTSTAYEVHLLSPDGTPMDKMSYNTKDAPINHDGREIVVNITK